MYGAIDTAGPVMKKKNKGAEREKRERGTMSRESARKWGPLLFRARTGNRLARDSGFTPSALFTLPLDCLLSGLVSWHGIHHWALYSHALANFALLTRPLNAPGLIVRAAT